MFYYYGRKKQLSRYYPTANYGTIIEPFAGAAAYSCYGNNWQKNVILIEKDEQVAAIWQWLIHSATSEEILAMPDLQIGEKTSNFLHIIHAVTKMAFHYKTIKTTAVLARNWEISKRMMAKNLHKVKHWTIICGDYHDAPDIEATWFIDPPYRLDPGMGYKYGSDRMDYPELAGWIAQRKGDVIACEGEYGDYLPFRPLITLKGVAGKRSQEKLFYRTERGSLQRPLFTTDNLVHV